MEKSPRCSQDSELFTCVKFMGDYLKFKVVSFVRDLTGNISAKFNLFHSLFIVPLREMIMSLP